MELKEFKKRYQGKYYKHLESDWLGYYYLKKVIGTWPMSYGGDGFLCIVDYLYKPNVNEPWFWRDDRIAIGEREKGNTERISRSEYYKVLSECGYSLK